MAKNNRAFQDEIADSAPLPIVHITSAYSCLLDVNSYVALIAKFRDLALHNGDIFDRMKHECGVLLISIFNGGVISRDSLLLWILLKETFSGEFKIRGASRDDLRKLFRIDEAVRVIVFQD